MDEWEEARRNVAVGRIVWMLRKQLGGTQDTMALSAGFDLRTYQRMETGERRVSAESWEMLVSEFEERFRKKFGMDALYEAGSDGRESAPVLFRSEFPPELADVEVLGKKFTLFTDDVTVIDAGAPFELADQSQEGNPPVIHQIHVVVSDCGSEYPLKLKGQWIPLRAGARLTLLYCRADADPFPMSALVHQQHEQGWLPISQSGRDLTFFTNKIDRIKLALTMIAGAILNLLAMAFGGAKLAPWPLFSGLIVMLFFAIRAAIRRHLLLGKITACAQKITFNPRVADPVECAGR